MSIIKFITLNFFIVLFVACGDMDRTKGPLFSILTDKKEFNQNEKVAISIKNNANKTIQKVSYAIDGKQLKAVDSMFVIDTKQLGNKVLTAKIDFDGGTEEVTKKIKIFANTAPEIYGFEILNE